MATKLAGLSPDPAEHVIETALAAFARGAVRLPLSPAAVQSFRDQFMPRVSSALERRDWQDAWHREKVYLEAYAEAMGQRARMLAADDRRRHITACDVHESCAKVRGYMPVAGRWCPS